jgi:hypothetical protein
MGAYEFHAPEKPEATTIGSTFLNRTTAVLWGHLADDGGSADCYYWFSYCPQGSSQWQATPITYPARKGKWFSEVVTGLLPGTTYFLRAHASNGKGESVGDILSFGTLPPDWQPPIPPDTGPAPDPVVTDEEVDQLGGPDAPAITVFGGSSFKNTTSLWAQVVDDKGQACHYWFVYRPKGSPLWRLTPNTYPASTGDLVLNYVLNLQPGTYECRAVVSNDAGTGISANVATFVVQPEQVSSH